MNLTFPYHEVVMFSALTQELVFSTENGKQSSVRPTCQGRALTGAHGNSEGEADLQHCGRHCPWPA